MRKPSSRRTPAYKNNLLPSSKPEPYGGGNNAAQQGLWRFRVLHAATVIRRGGVVLYPTEGVWGLGCDPRNPVAIRRLMQLKRRDIGKGLILLLANDQAARPWLAPQLTTPVMGSLRRFARYRPPYRLHRRKLAANLAPRSSPLDAKSSSPRATTYLYRSRQSVPALLRGRHKTLAVRCTQYPPAQALSGASGGLITSTSANISGMRPPALSRWAVLRQWGRKVDAVLGAPLGGQSRPSRIFDTVSRQWIRE